MSRFEAIRELYGFKDEPRIDLPLWHKWANCVDDFEKLSTEEVYDKFGEKGLELQTNQLKRKAMRAAADSAPKKARAEGSHPAVLLSFIMNRRSGGDFAVPMKMTLEKAVAQLLEHIKYDDAHLWYLTIPGIGKVCNSLYEGFKPDGTLATKVTLEQTKPITGDRWMGVHDIGDNNVIAIFIKNHDYSATEANRVTRISAGSVAPQYPGVDSDGNEIDDDDE